MIYFHVVQNYSDTVSRRKTTTMTTPRRHHRGEIERRRWHGIPVVHYYNKAKHGSIVLIHRTALPRFPPILQIIICAYVTEHCFSLSCFINHTIVAITIIIITISKINIYLFRNRITAQWYRFSTRVTFKTYTRVYPYNIMSIA